MGCLTNSVVLPSELKPTFSLPHLKHLQSSLVICRRRVKPKIQKSFVPVLFLPFIIGFLELKSYFNQLILVKYKSNGKQAHVMHNSCVDWRIWLEQVARLFGPAIFEASKLKVLFLGVDEKKHPGNLPRTYTLTHSDITSKLTLAISQTINNSQVIDFFAKINNQNPLQLSCFEFIFGRIFRSALSLEQ